MTRVADWWLLTENQRQDVESRDGEVTFNYLQQSKPEIVIDDCQPATVTTDPWGISA